MIVVSQMIEDNIYTYESTGLSVFTSGKYVKCKSIDHLNGPTDTIGIYSTPDRAKDVVLEYVESAEKGCYDTYYLPMT